MKRQVALFVLILIIAACKPELVKKETPQPSVQQVYWPLYVIKEKVNMRSQPTTSSQVVAELTDGSVLNIQENQNGWYKIITDDGQQGWLRSDLAGPCNLSLTRLASAFADSVMPAFNAKLFFDTSELYKIIYLNLQQKYYKSKIEAAEQAKKIGQAYQTKVYPGKVEIRVMRPQSEELFTRITLPAIGLTNVPVPILDFGVLYSLKETNKTIDIKIIVPESLSEKQMLKSARRISGIYDYPYTKAEIYMISDSPAGRKYLKTRKVDAGNKKVCQFYYLEDADGEDYHTNFCE